MVRQLFIKILTFPVLDKEVLSHMSFTIGQTYKQFARYMNPEYKYNFKSDDHLTIEHDCIHFDNLCYRIIDRLEEGDCNINDYKFNMYVGEEIDGVMCHRVYMGLLPIKVRKQIEELPRLYLVTFSADSVVIVPELDNEVEPDCVMIIKEE